MAAPRAAENSVDDRISIIFNSLKDEDDFCAHELPGFKELLSDYLEKNGEPDRIDFFRRFLKVLKESETDNTYQGLRDRQTQDARHRLESFVDGASPAEVVETLEHPANLRWQKQASADLQAPRATVLPARVHVEGLSDDEHKHKGFISFVSSLKDFFADVFDKNDERAATAVYQDVKFENWGKTFESVPQYTCVPRSVKAVQGIVHFAKQNNFAVRASGFRHTWAPVFAKDRQILISTIPLEVASVLPNFTALPFGEPAPNELETIEFTDDAPLPGGQRLVRIGTAVTNERLRRWCVDNRQVTMPANVIMVEITAGGANAQICHGAGRRNRTLSDIVHRVEYVDANGEFHIITEKDQEFLKAASGCFGLIGIITHLTLALDPMTYAEMRPAKVPMILAIPPPPGMSDDDIPPALRPVTPLTTEQKRKAQVDFEERANDYYYAEWFWFPYSDMAWINCWQNTTSSDNAKSWPSNEQIFLSFIETFAMNLIQDAAVFQRLIETTGLAEAAVTLLSRLAMLSLPEVKDDHASIKTLLPDALHFQRAIQNIRVRDMEVEMPLVPQKNNPTKPDYSTVQRAWWDAVLKCYEHSKACPQRMPLEMRIMGGSEVTMAPQRGNELGTCSIEILTTESAVGIWKDYAQEVLDKWMGYTDGEGKRLRTRPHWAKEWVPYKVDGKPWMERLKNEDYKDEIVEFKSQMKAIGERDGWKLEDAQKRFSNDMFDELFYS